MAMPHSTSLVASAGLKTRPQVSIGCPASDVADR
jgi:hypothetical protein